MSIFARPASEIYSPPPHTFRDVPDTDGHYARWGYSLASEHTKTGRNVPRGGNTAIFRIFPGATTEPVYVTKAEKDAKFTVRPLLGIGALVRARGSSPVSFIRLQAGTGDTAIIRPGDAYFYLNTGEEDLVLHDTAVPAFRIGDDLELTSSHAHPVGGPLPVSEEFAHTVVKRGGLELNVTLSDEFFAVLGQALAGTLEVC